MTHLASSRLNEPIAVIGTGLKFPGGTNNPTQLWDLLQHPREVQTSIPADRFNTDGFCQSSHDGQGSSHTRHGYFLSGDHRQFDAEFFGIKPVEANSMDPQQRLLLEVVYESIEAAGLDMIALRGSSTAVYVGLMAVDYIDMLNRDTSDFPPYVAAGTSRSILSNRISHFFDWRGPSMTIDTACSSSLVAVHLAIQSLRSGECKLAIAAGTNLMLGPEQFLVGSSMKMLSPDGRSFWCDDRANGYARGEGIAAIVLKTLSAAVADGDDIECVIAGTGLNQDGRTQGLTVPSAEAQATLIQTTYKTAGLDLKKSSDRPQYFEAHGTGTPTGDPLEVKAIHDAFFADADADGSKDQLYCGSVKTIIGHTEGTAGLAGLIKTSLALQHGVIPPNLLFNSLAPSVKPFFNNLKIPVKAEIWPALVPGAIRRASVNSFGFGGTNVHCILEHYNAVSRENTTLCGVTNLPFVFSAPSKKALIAVLKSYLEYCSVQPAIDLQALSHTLCTRRTTFPIRLAFSAKSIEDLTRKLNSAANQEGAKLSTTTAVSASQPQILGIFTGQGAQWAGMANQLMQYPGAVAFIDELDRSLADLPDPPSWSLKAELSRDQSHSRIKETAIAQPVCTAVQMLLVMMLRAAGVRFSAVVGHSSGEIAAAYTAGYLSARDAVRVAYYRGRHVHLIGGRNGERGSMIAIGASYEEAQSLCNQDSFRGRICIAASNSASSVTLSGDISAVEEVQAIFKESNRFARLLRVDHAFHSHHMIRCSEAITASYRACKIESQRPTNPNCLWVSSVYHRDINLVTDSLDDQYWHSNTIGEVLFSQALECALQKSHFDLAVEIGAHPALKGPAMQVIGDTIGHTIPYTGTLNRGVEDDEAFVSTLGYIWANLSTSNVDFAGYDLFMNASDRPRPLKGLPAYPWDHERVYWHESRVSRAFRYRSNPCKLLGIKGTDYSEDQMSWKNSLVPEKLSWLSDHRIQGQIVFPGAAYIVSAFEAAREVAGEQPAQLIELTNLVFGQPLVFAAEDSRVEVLMSLNGIQRRRSKMTARFTYHSIAKEASGPMTLNAHCRLSIHFGESTEVIPQSPAKTEFGMQDVESERIYSSFANNGFQYTGPFRSLESVSRRSGFSSGLVRMPDPTSQIRTMLHPATVDAVMHSIMVAHSYPGDGRLSFPRIPTEVSRISLHLPAASRGFAHQHLKFTSRDANELGQAKGSATLSSVDSAEPILQLEGVRTKDMIPATQANDVHMFSETVWGPAYPSIHDIYHATGLVHESRRDVVHQMASATEQLSHRYPGMHILGIGLDSRNDTIRFLSGLQNVFASYTHTNSSDESLNVASSIIDAQDDKIRYRKLVSGLDFGDQGLVAQSSDLVVAFSMPVKEQELRQMLDNVRHVLRPGGYFLYPQSEDFEIFPALWEQSIARSECNGPLLWLSPLERLSSRKRILETHGFAEVEQQLQTGASSSYNGQGRIALLQAIDDRILFLRDPLDQTARHPQISAGEFTLIAGGTIATSACVDQVEDILQACGGKVTRTNSISSMLNTGAQSVGSVLVLQDYDKPLFEDLNQIVLSGLKKLFATSKNVLWVTHGYKRNAPHARMFVAFARCLVQEMAHVRFQILDFASSDALDASLISRDFLRLYVTGIWEEQGRMIDILWSVEPEISYDKGRMFLPRVKLSKTLNDRYNADRRSIMREVNSDAEIISISTEQNAYVLRAEVSASQSPIQRSHITVQVTYSFLKAVKVERSGFFYLLLGTDVTGNEQVIVLSSKLSSRVVVPKELVRSCPLPKDEAVQYLKFMYYGFISCTILRGLTPDDSILLLEPDTCIKAILPVFASASGVQVMFSAALGEQNIEPNRLLRTPGRKVSDILREANLARVVCWNDDDWTTSIRCEIPTGLPVDEINAYIAVASSPVTSLSVARALHTFDRVQGHLRSTAITTSSCGTTRYIGLADLAGACSDTDLVEMVDWETKLITKARIQPVDHGELFQCDRTYWLVGLTGDLGLSLCQWMITKGAKHIALSSRHPKVDPAWLAHFQSLGTTVEILTCDVTNYQSVESTMRSIEASMPLIAGVCHGAMVLQDALFDDLNMTRVERVLKPKVDGAVHLDRVFRNHPLDFFVMLSSIAAITGNPGQSIYAAANGFLAGLSAQRRARGECAATINMGAILGTGATLTLTTVQQKSLEKAGVMWTSVQDFHTAFAEAVVANRSCSMANGEITTGVRVCDVRKGSKPRHASNPIFSHMVVHSNDSAQPCTVLTPPESVRARLLQATNEKALFQILEDFLMSKLRKALQMSPDSAILDKTADSLGIDSLIAVEMRSWLVKELSIDLPLLIIIGGNSMQQVLEACRVRLDPIKTPLIQAEPDQLNTTEVPSSHDDENISKSHDVPAAVLPAHSITAGMVNAPNVAVSATKQSGADPANPVNRQPEVDAKATSDTRPIVAKPATASDTKATEETSVPVGRRDEYHHSTSFSCSDDASSGTNQQIGVKGSVIAARRINDDSPQSTPAMHRKGLFSRILRSRRFARLREYL